jgi:hypothetical protein
MFGSDNIQSMTVFVSDPGADNKQIPLWRAPVAAEILRAYITVQNVQQSGSAGAFALLNYGTSGTALAGTVAAAKGGTATASILAANVPTAYTLTEGTLSAGQWMTLDYQETGDWVEGLVSITWDYVLGIGA